MPEDNAPQFPVGKGIVKFEPDTAAVDEALTAMEKRIDSLGSKLRTAFSFGSVLDDVEQRIDRIAQRVSSIKVADSPNERVSVDPVTNEVSPPILFDVDRKFENAAKPDTMKEAIDLLTEIRDLMLRQVEMTQEL